MALRDRFIMLLLFTAALIVLVISIEEMRLYPYASSVLLFFAVSTAGGLLFYTFLSTAFAAAGAGILTIAFILLPFIEGSAFIWPAVILGTLTIAAVSARMYSERNASSS
ncbi:hypothetical protein [Sinobaca sp. H24]|uniref:hypothetical protein n=1 Tax=Sinobaca sp. H24 TaxID=2923376 RepID=UPI00207A2204|nr:hypothetical protein [Sinobaca sp. H24]